MINNRYDYDSWAVVGGWYYLVWDRSLGADGCIYDGMIEGDQHPLSYFLK